MPWHCLTRHPAIAEITDTLEAANRRGELPNPNVIRLVQNYFMELSVVIAELARVCRPGASVFMVNDNVQYHGEEVPVDLILSDLASSAVFTPNQSGHWRAARATPASKWAGLAARNSASASIGG